MTLALVALGAAAVVLLLSRAARASTPEQGRSPAPPGPRLRSPFASRVVVTSAWGDPRLYRNGVHEGVDYDVPVGTPILAIEAGVVEVASRDPCQTAGMHISIKGDSGEFRATYMHLSHVGVSRGEHVMAGQPIGLSGKTGGNQRGPGCTFGEAEPHLHLTLRANATIAARYPEALRGATRDGYTAIPAESQIPMVLSQRTAERSASRAVPLAAGATVAA